MLKKLVKIANALDNKGLYTDADLVDRILKKAIENPVMIPDDQLNIENQGYGGGEGRVGGGYSGLSIDEAMRAEDTEYEKEWCNFMGLDFRVHEARKLAEKYTPIQKPVKDSQYGLHTVNKEYAMTTDLTQPLIYATLILSDDKGKFTYELCIDGSHRAYKADKMGISTLPSVVLSPEDTLKVMADGPTKDKMIKAMEDESSLEQDNVDIAVRNNGLDGNSVTDNQNAGSFQGFSDAYFYRGYGNLEGIYGPQNR